MLQGALFGAIGAVIGILIVLIVRNQKVTSLKRNIAHLGAEYSGFFYYASPKRYKKALKVYDSSGILYLIGNVLYYKTGTAAAPIAFNLAECTLKMEPDWRKLKWFSITTPAGIKYYFDSYKMGAFSNNSEETLRAYNIFQSKIPVHIQQSSGPPPPPPPPAN
ncbi:MAG: hypothetical protein LC128_01785 [Chitinophagales bacterium]|nr:hypothetical protein [Chitinophagales bacterium]